MRSPGRVTEAVGHARGAALPLWRARLHRARVGLRCPFAPASNSENLRQLEVPANSPDVRQDRTSQSTTFMFHDARRDQKLYSGLNVGLQNYSPYASRSRRFGGATSRWGGMSRPFEAIDFEQRSWIRHSGSPFSAGELSPYSRRAHGVAHLGPYMTIGSSPGCRPSVRCFPSMRIGSSSAPIGSRTLSILGRCTGRSSRRLPTSTCSSTRTRSSSRSTRPRDD